jgi:hypothetical protein
MKTKEYRLKLGSAPKALKLPRDARRLGQAKPANPTIEAETIFKALKATTGSKEILAKYPEFGDFKRWLPLATFSVCMKTGTALYLDIWDSDHFDLFTDMKRCITDCRAWFSADGFTFWDSPQTKTGRVNCFFNAPATGNYICNAHLQSYGGAAQVECLIDSFSFGPLAFNGTINQPHPTNLRAGTHSFRIRQRSGSFFFIGLTVWRV